jgi:hypothetical protein
MSGPQPSLLVPHRTHMEGRSRAHLTSDNSLVVAPTSSANDRHRLIVSLVAPHPPAIRLIG